MDLLEERDSTLLGTQKQRLSFLVRKSRKLEARLAELRSEDHQMVLQNLNLSDYEDGDQLKEVKQLIDSVNKLKAEYYCLSYQTNVYNGMIPPGLIDYMPDQPVENTLTVDRLIVENIDSSGSQMASDENTDTTPNSPTGDLPSTSNESSAENGEIKDPQSWPCLKCSFINHPLIDLCEICEHPRHKFDGSTPIVRPLIDNKCELSTANKCSQCANSTCYCHLTDSSR